MMLDPATLATDDVEMVIAVRQLPATGRRGTEARLADQTEFGEEGKGPVDRCQIDGLVDGVHRSGQLIDCYVTIGRRQCLPDPSSRARDAISVPGKKLADVGVCFGHGPERTYGSRVARSPTVTRPGSMTVAYTRLTGPFAMSMTLKSPSTNQAAF